MRRSPALASRNWRIDLVSSAPHPFYSIPGQMRTFLDQTGGLWAPGALYGKLASVLAPLTGGGQNRRLPQPDYPCSSWMVIVPIGWGGAQELFDVSQVRGGTPGATTIAGGDGSRQPSNEELLSPAIRVNTSRSGQN